MPDAKQYEVIQFEEYDGVLQVHNQAPDSYDSILEFELSDFKLIEFAHVRDDSGFEIFYQINVGD